MLEFCPTGTVGVGSLEKESVSFNRTNEISPMESHKACVYPISPVDDSGGPLGKCDTESRGSVSRLGLGPEETRKGRREDDEGVFGMNGEEEEEEVEQG